MNKIDLHVHSTYSDGTLTPTEIALHAKEMGLSAFALTDHDCVDGIVEAVLAGENLDLEVIPGVELSTFIDEKEIHIVGLYINYMDETFRKELSDLQNIRELRNIEICKRFTDLGIPMDYENMKKMYPDAVITRAHFADYLLANGHIHSRSEAFERYLSPNKPCYVPRKKMSPKRAIELIHSAGGVAILAHPVLYHLGKEQMQKLLDYLCEAEIDGLEAIYSTYTTSDENEMRRFAKERNLLISGGSDYHGANKPYIELGIGKGHLFVPYTVLEKIKSYHNTQ